MFISDYKEIITYSISDDEKLQPKMLHFTWSKCQVLTGVNTTQFRLCFVYILLLNVTISGCYFWSSEIECMITPFVSKYHKKTGLMTVRSEQEWTGPDTQICRTGPAGRTKGGGMLRFWNVIVLVLVLNFVSFFCDLLASVGLVNKNGCKGQH